MYKPQNVYKIEIISFFVNCIPKWPSLSNSRCMLVKVWSRPGCICGNLYCKLTVPPYGVFISQLIRYSRACISYHYFLDNGLLLIIKLMHCPCFSEIVTSNHYQILGVCWSKYEANLAVYVVTFIANSMGKMRST
jgi:hypothetical protein